jgi:hypothetical protein
MSSTGTAVGTLERPGYYWSGDVDVIKVVEIYDLHFHIGNALKYVVRAGAKGEALPDLRKAREYLARWLAWEQWRPQMRGSPGMDWMHPIKVAAHFGLSGRRRQIVIALLEGAAMADEEPRIREALAMLDELIDIDSIVGEIEQTVAGQV